MPSVRSAVRGLPRSLERDSVITEAHRQSAQLVLVKAKEYAPKRSYALVNSGRVVGSSVRFGNSLVDYVPVVLSRGQPFIARAILDTKSSRNDLYQKAVAKALASYGLTRKR